MLVGYWPGERQEGPGDPPPHNPPARGPSVPHAVYTRTPELIGFQRWAIGGYDKQIGWTEWANADYQPTNLRRDLRSKGQQTFELN